MALNMNSILLHLYVFCLSIFYASLALARLLFIWIRNPSKNIFDVKVRDSAPACLTDSNLGNHRYIKLKSIKLHYVEKGDRSRPLMLFVHGFPEFWYSWRHQIKEFSKDYWTVAVDMRGYGDSEKPVELGKYKKSVLVEDIKELIEGLGKKSCIMVSHDWGGAIGWSFLNFYPQMVERYIIMNAPHTRAYIDVVKKYKKQFFMSWYIFFFQLPYLPELYARTDDMAMFKMMKSANKNNGITEEDIEAYKYTFGKPGAFTGPINYYRANYFNSHNKERNPNTREKISVPGLLIWGEKDFYLDKRIPELTKNYVNNIKIEFVQGANHFVQQDDPESTNAAMRRFLQS